MKSRPLARHMGAVGDIDAIMVDSVKVLDQLAEPDCRSRVVGWSGDGMPGYSFPTRKPRGWCETRGFILSTS